MDTRVIKAKKCYVGTSYKTNSSGICEIVDYVTSKEIYVKFLDYGNVVKCDLSNLRNGNVLNPLHPTFKGVGFLGLGDYKFTDFGLGSLWRSMLLRCNLSTYDNRYSTYNDVTVCKEWYDFQNLAKWCVDQKGFNCVDTKGRKFQLDKDLLIEGSKIYSPETCCFVPNEINCFFSTGAGGNESISRGVRKVSSGKYQSRLGSKHLGTYNTEDEAKKVYEIHKFKKLSNVLEVYKSSLNNDLLEKLLALTETKLKGS